MKYIGIDIGSSFIKSVLIDVETFEVVGHTKSPTPQKNQLSDDRKFEISASSFMVIIESLIDSYTKEYHDIAGVLLSTQMHGFVYSVKGKKDVYISWQDTRCLNIMQGKNESYMNYLKQQLSPDDMEKCGVYIKPSLGLCNLYALLNSNEVSDNGTLYTIGSYIISKLTGNNVCHITNAAPLGMVDITKRSWDKSIINELGFENIAFPTIVENDFESCGTFISNGQKLDIFPDYGDQQIAILGSAPGKKDIVINIATASQVSNITNNFEPGKYEIRPYFEGLYINTISNMPSGRGLDVLIRFVQHLISQVSGIHVTDSQIWCVIQKDFQFDSRGIIVNSEFYETPMNLKGGSILGIKSENLSINSLFSAAFEDMAKTYWENIQVLNGENDFECLVCAGGVAWKVPELIQVIERVTGHVCVLSAMPDEALLGLFRVALVCAGIYDNLSHTKGLKLISKEKK